MKKSIIYYTDNQLRDPIYSTVHNCILRVRLPIISASLKPISFGDNEVIKGESSYPTMVKQIISCLERSKTKYVFFCEHDVLYPKSHFDFIPPRDNIFYYNKNVWRWLFKSNYAIRYDRMIPLSCMSANRKFTLEHYKLRAKKIEEMGWDRIKSKEPSWVRKIGYEPGTKKKKRGGLTDDDFSTWISKYPIIDIRHKKTFSRPKVKVEEFKHIPKWWKETSIDKIKGWNLKKLFNL